MLIKTIATVGLGLLSVYFLLSKSYFLARWRLGWFMMLANVPYEAFCRGWRKRWHVDMAALVLVGAGWLLVWGPWAVAAWWLAFGAAWAYSLLADLQWQSGALTVQDKSRPGRMPLPLPQLIVHLKGPILARGRTHNLGDWPVGRAEDFEFLILNPADRVHCQFPFEFELIPSSDAVRVEDGVTGKHNGPDSGEVVRLPFRLRAMRPADAVTIRYRLTLGSYSQSGVLHIVSIFDPAGVAVREVKINRWKGGARGAWVWRGDTDLFDPATWQSPEGLLPSLELSRRFRVPHTFFLSARLTTDEEESRAHSEHFGLDRRSHRIPEFIEWLRKTMAPENEIDWPFEMRDGRYPCELGNHMWLHYGTHSSADPGNNWTTWLNPGKGKYTWSAADHDSLKEQTDNAMKCTETFQRLFDFTTTAWGIPGRGGDRYTAEALERAGILVASDSDCQAFVNVFCQPPPHHPRGTTHLVELSKKYPGDPRYGNQCAMLKYWTWHARRHGRVMVLMGHHHLRGWESATCFRLAEELIHDAVGRMHGDLYLGTMSAVGLYWERVLCPEHRWVTATAGVGTDFTVANRGARPLEAVPVEVVFSNGARTLALVDVAAGGSVKVDWSRAGP